jgi:hypothetical protein
MDETVGGILLGDYPTACINVLWLDFFSKPMNHSYWQYERMPYRTISIENFEKPSFTEIFNT